MNKYKLTENTKEINGITLHQIRALISFADVNEGDLGGWIEKEENLSQYGDAWVFGNASVYGDARVSGNARIKNTTDYTTVQGFGSEQRVTTFFRCEDGKIRTQCGCFYGTIEEFREKVKETHKDTKYAKEYMMIADLMEYHFEESEGEKE